MKRRIFFFVLTAVLLPVRPVPAGEIPDEPVLDEATVEIARQVILNIFDDIMAAKPDYPALQEFGEDDLYKNPRGLPTIIYEYNPSDVKDDKDPRNDPYAFAVTIDGLEDNSFESFRKGKFNYGFPALALKISGYQKKHLLRTQFDIMPLVFEHGRLLADHQQDYLPLRLFLRPVKKTFQVKEDIILDVILKNVSKRHMVVKPLSSQSLYFLFNNSFWGTSPTSGKRSQGKKVLKSGESLTLRIKGESFQRAQKVEVTAFYRVNIRGINPSARMTLDIVK
ncbi:MAG: hypothetical protein ACLFPX_05830 [Candidatus Omnitrophota bacterium]